MKIEFSETQCENLAEFIELNIFDMIRNDDCIDGIGWLADMMDTYTKLKSAAKQTKERGIDG